MTSQVTDAHPVSSRARVEVCLDLAGISEQADRYAHQISGGLAGTVIAVTFLGATSRVTVDLGDATIMAQLPTSDATALSAGRRVTLAIRPDPVLVSGAVPAAGGE